MSYQPKMKQMVNVMTIAALATGVIAPIVAPVDVSANSKNIVDKVLHVDYDYASGKNALNYLIIKEDDVNFTKNDTFRFTLPAGVKWQQERYNKENKETYINADGSITNETTGKPQFKVIQVTGKDLELQIIGDWDKVNDNLIHVPIFFKVDGAKGELKVTVNPKDSTLTAGQYTFAVIAEGKTATTVSEVNTIGDGGAIGTIRIDELALKTMEPGTVTLTLPTGFTWIGTPIVKLGNTSLLAKIDITNKRKAIITVDDDVLSTDMLNTVYVSGLAIDAEKDAPYGEIEAQVSGNGITDQDVVVGKYADYSTDFSITSEIPTLLAGRNNPNNPNDLKTVEVDIKEKVAGSWINGRQVNVEFPSWVKVVGIDLIKQSGFSTNIDEDHYFTISDNDINFIITPAKDNAKREMKVKFLVSTQADATGNIIAKFGGKAGIEGDVLVAKAAAPVKVEFSKADVRTGIKNQSISNITMTESAKGALLAGKQVEFRLSDNVKFSNKPTIEVIEGNIKIDENSIQVKNNKLIFQVQSESTRASKIMISNVKVNLDRTVPEGDIEVEVGGLALVQNADKKIPIADFKFNKDYILKKAIAIVVTPAQGNERVGEVVFKVGEKTYTEAGVIKTMDVAPFIEASRTYLPVRYVAKSIGVEGPYILWDDEENKVTILKGNRIAQLTIGSNILIVNGVKMKMDTKAKIVDGRTVLPLRAVAQSLGASVDWSEAFRTVTVK